MSTAKELLQQEMRPVLAWSTDRVWGVWAYLLDLVFTKMPWELQQF